MSPRADLPAVLLFTRAESGTELASLYEGLKRQTWTGWRWVVSDADGAILPPACEGDARVVAFEPSLWREAADGFWGVVPPGFVLRPAALERWIWFLFRSPSFLVVDGLAARGTDRLAGRFLSAEALGGELPFLAQGRLAGLLPGPEEISNDVLWARALRPEPGALGWTIPEISFQAAVVAAPILGPEAEKARRAYFDAPEGMRVVHRRNFQQIDARLGWKMPPSPSEEGKRVLMVLPWLLVNGANTFNLYIAQTLREAGHAVSVVTLAAQEHPRSPDFERLTDDVFHLEQFLDPHDYPAFLAHLIRSRGVDLVFLSETHLGKYLVPLLREQFPEVAFFDYCHVLHLDERSGSHPRQTAALLSQLDLASTSSAFLRGWMIEAGAREPERVEVCYTGVDTAFWSAGLCRAPDLRMQMGIPPERPIILYACRLALQKNPMLFAEVLARLALEDKRDFHALIVGDGIYRAAMEDYFAKAGISDRVLFLGFASLEQMREIYGISDVFFLPSLWEGVSLGLYEAMAMGLPSIVTDVGGQRELLTSECGRLIAPDSRLREASQAALGELLADPALRRRMGQAARERVMGEFSLDEIGPRMLALFDLARKLRREAPREPWSAEAATEMVRQEIALEYAETVREDLTRQRNAVIQQAARQQQEIARLTGVVKSLKGRPT